ncbi:hypothetical protein [Nocardia pseudobrasiliensis]|nr:hypothetical protein [Nocardia pseudobrasiliensis]
MATTSLPLATAAAVATILSAPANAAPGDQAPVPTTPASPQENSAAPQDQNAPQTNQQGNAQQGNPQQQGAQQGNQQQADPQPGNNCTPTPNNPCQPAPNQQTNPQQQPGTSNPQQPGTTPQQPGTSPQQPGTGPQQPGTTTPQQPGTSNQNGPQMAGPQQPGVTNPRVAPLPVPGQNSVPNPPQATTPDQTNPGQQQELKPGQQPQGQTTPAPQQQGGNSDNLTGNQGSQQQQRWNSPSLQQAPAAPVVTMTGPHTEVGANIDGGAVLPGFVANTHHFSNLDGYVGTIGYNTPTGSGDAGASLEFVEPNRIKVTYYTHATDREDAKSETYIDTTQANAAKAAVEGWIRQQPGGAAALDAAARIGRLPEGEIAPAQLNVAGVTGQLGGDVQY